MRELVCACRYQDSLVCKCVSVCVCVCAGSLLVHSHRPTSHIYADTSLSSHMPSTPTLPPEPMGPGLTRTHINLPVGMPPCSSQMCMSRPHRNTSEPKSHMRILTQTYIYAQLMCIQL